MAKNKLVAPFLKWVGGKRQLISGIEAKLPEDFSRLKYYEPFIGGGAVLFNFQPKQAVINDANSELINTYEVIRDDLDALIEDLKTHPNKAEYFYELRALDRNDAFAALSKVKRASRIIFLNKTCFNGLYRVNNAGEFNSPFGNYEKPNIVNEPVLRAVSRYLNTSNITISQGDYDAALKKVTKNSFIYLDPPYHPISDSSSFTGYVSGGWRKEEQERLKAVCDELHRKGAKFLLSNSNAKLINDLYRGYNITTIKASRSINSVGSKRGEIDELLISNYD